jgi:hypothetical protein
MAKSLEARVEWLERAHRQDKARLEACTSLTFEAWKRLASLQPGDPVENVKALRSAMLESADPRRHPDYGVIPVEEVEAQYAEYREALRDLADMILAAVRSEANQRKQG